MFVLFQLSLQSCRWLHHIYILVIMNMLLEQTSHLLELVLWLKLTKYWYLFFNFMLGSFIYIQTWHAKKFRFCPRTIGKVGFLNRFCLRRCRPYAINSELFLNGFCFYDISVSPWRNGLTFLFLYPQVIDLKTQLSYFKNLKKHLKNKLGDAETKTLLFRAVYLINIGSNDYIVPFTRNPSLLQSYSQEEYTDMVIGNLTFVI